MIAGVDEVRILDRKGPWTTKSGGNLEVDFNIPWEELGKIFLNYSFKEVAMLPKDIRGLRIYRIHDLVLGRTGGNEFHRIRTEIIFCTKGAVRWIAEDVWGSRKEIVIRPGISVFMPPFILHRYEVIENGSEIEVLANTIFDPDDPRTHDSYPAEEFKKLAER